MIVVDVKIVAYLFIEGERTGAAEAVFEADPDWGAPLLWRSEWRNVLAGYIRRGELDAAGANERLHQAEALLRGREFLPDGERVLELVARSSCSAYDCEYVAVTEAMNAPLITSDRRVLDAFPDWVLSPEAYTGLL